MKAKFWFKDRFLELEVITEKIPGVFDIQVGTNNLDLDIHVLPLKDIVWGYHEEWYDGPLYCLGFGPLLMFAWATQYTAWRHRRRDHKLSVITKE